MPPGDGLYDIETGYKIQHGDTAESILQELRSLPEGMRPWFCQFKNGWYDTSGGAYWRVPRRHTSATTMVEVGRYRGST